MRRVPELRFEMGFGSEHHRERGGYSRGHGRGHHRHRGDGMDHCHSRSDDHFGRGGRGGGHGGHGGHGDHGRHGGGYGRGRGRGSHGEYGHHERGRGHGRGQGRFGGSRRISADELQLLVLSLLVEKPLHGYQIIKELETLSQGFYKPSPGMIYPMLSFLEESELAAVEMDGTKKSYVITESGKASFAENSERAKTLLEWLKAQGALVTAMENAYELERKSAGHPLKTKMKEMRTLLHNRPDIDEATMTQLGDVLDEAITKIKRVLS